MTAEAEADRERGSVPARPGCPLCGGALSEPVSGDVHCYVACTSCGERFDLKDPRILPG